MIKNEIDKIIHDESDKILNMLFHAFEDQYKGVLAIIEKHPETVKKYTESEYKSMMMESCMYVLKRFIDEYPDYFYMEEYGFIPDIKSKP